MLAKLLKYDFKSMFKIFFPLWGVLLVVSVINRLFLGSGLDAEGGLGLVNILMVLLYTLLIVAVMVVTIVIIIVRFYQGLLKDEGYLMFTIPVRPRQLIASKLISALVVALLSWLVAVVSVFIIAAYSGMWNDLIQAIKEISELMPNFTLLIVLAVVSLFVGIACSISEVYAAMALGHLAPRHRVGFSVLAFIGLNMAWSAVDAVISLLGYPGSMNSLVITTASTGFMLSMGKLTDYLMMPLVLGIVPDVVRCVVHFILINYILSRKLNLE